ncbi:MAG: hypothetical protein WKF59_03615 [Chitinophagaceae bacterium]
MCRAQSSTVSASTVGVRSMFGTLLGTNTITQAASGAVGKYFVLTIRQDFL